MGAGRWVGGLVESAWWIGGCWVGDFNKYAVLSIAHVFRSYPLSRKEIIGSIFPKNASLTNFGKSKIIIENTLT